MGRIDPRRDTRGAMVEQVRNGVEVLRLAEWTTLTYPSEAAYGDRARLRKSFWRKLELWKSGLETMWVEGRRVKQDRVMELLIGWLPGTECLSDTWEAAARAAWTATAGGGKVTTVLVRSDKAAKLMSGVMRRQRLHGERAKRYSFSLGWPREEDMKVRTWTPLNQPLNEKTKLEARR